MKKIVATFPSALVKIIKIRNWCESINENQLVLRAKSSLHGATPCKIIGSIQFWRNIERSWTLTGMNIEWRISIRRILTRSHGRTEKKRSIKTQKRRRNCGENAEKEKQEASKRSKKKEEERSFNGGSD